MDNNQVNNTDEFNLRNARMASVIGICAVMVAGAAFIRNIASYIATMLGGGIAYRMMGVMFLVVLAGAIMLACDVVKYILCDLRRYNLHNYDKRYDQMSDDAYNELFKDAKAMLIYFSAMVFVYMLFTVYVDMQLKGTGLVLVLSIVAAIFARAGKGIIVAIIESIQASAPRYFL